MSLYNFIVEKIVLPAGDLALGSRYTHHLKRWRKLQWSTRTELAQLQADNLSRMLKYATEKVPYYRELNLSVSPNPYDDLLRFPVMYKKEIKGRMDDFVVGDKSRLVCERSSGSSGIQGEVYLSKDEASASQAIQTLWWEWAGYRPGNSLVQTGITPNRGMVKSIKDFLLRTRYISAYNINEQNALQLLLDLERHPRQHFGGYASSLYVYANIAKKQGITGVKFHSVFSWGDKLFPHFRSLIEEQFQTKIYDTYGCTEGLMMAGQCSHGSMHLMTPHVVVELLDDAGNRVQPGQLGKVVVTRLDNFSMPLIRYYLGDLAVMGPSTFECGCGRHFPVLEKIIGRDTDIVKTRSGKFMVVHFFTGIMEHVPQVKQFRIVQHNLDGVVFEYIPDEGFREEVLHHIAKKIHDYLSEDFPVQFTEVSTIAPTPSGKPQLIQSNLNKI